MDAQRAERLKTLRDALEFSLRYVEGKFEFKPERNPMEELLNALKSASLNEIDTKISELRKTLNQLETLRKIVAAGRKESDADRPKRGRKNKKADQPVEVEPAGAT